MSWWRKKEKVTRIKTQVRYKKDQYILTRQGLEVARDPSIYKIEEMLLDYMAPSRNKSFLPYSLRIDLETKLQIGYRDRTIFRKSVRTMNRINRIRKKL